MIELDGASLIFSTAAAFLPCFSGRRSGTSVGITNRWPARNTR